MRRLLEERRLSLELEFLVGWMADGDELAAAEAAFNELLTAAAELGACHIKVGPDMQAKAWPMAHMCERFAGLVLRLEPRIAEFYRGLEASEARHGRLYVDLAAQHATVTGLDWQARLAELAAVEAELVADVQAWRAHRDQAAVDAALADLARLRAIEAAAAAFAEAEAKAATVNPDDLFAESPETRHAFDESDRLRAVLIKAVKP
jgi:hypothetical protein